MLRFEQVAALRVSYVTFNALHPKERWSASYGAVIVVPDDPWGVEVVKACKAQSGAETLPRELRHLMITFDDAPCYEFVCGKFCLVVVDSQITKTFL